MKRSNNRHLYVEVDVDFMEMLLLTECVQSVTKTQLGGSNHLQQLLLSSAHRPLHLAQVQARTTKAIHRNVNKHLKSDQHQASQGHQPLGTSPQIDNQRLAPQAQVMLVIPELIHPELRRKIDVGLAIRKLDSQDSHAAVVGYFVDCIDTRINIAVNMTTKLKEELKSQRTIPL